MRLNQQLFRDEVEQRHQPKAQEASDHYRRERGDRNGSERADRQQQRQGRDDHDDAQARAIGFRQLVGQRQTQEEHFERKRDRQQEPCLLARDEREAEHQAINQNVDADRRQQRHRSLEAGLESLEPQHRRDTRRPTDQRRAGRSLMLDLRQDFGRCRRKHDAGGEML